MRDNDRDPMRETIACLKEYMSLRLDKFKLKLVEHLAISMSSILGVAIVIVLCSFALLFIIVALTLLLGDLIGSLIGAIFIMAGIFLIAALIVYANRHKVMVNAMVRMFAKMLFEPDKNNDDE